MTSNGLQTFGPPVLATAGHSLPATAKALRQKTSHVVVRLAAFEASVARRASALAEPALVEDDDILFHDETEMAAGGREPSAHAMLRALGMAVSLLLIWMGVQII
jgi:hypothetical protein